MKKSGLSKRLLTLDEMTHRNKKSSTYVENPVFIREQQYPKIEPKPELKSIGEMRFSTVAPTNKATQQSKASQVRQAQVKTSPVVQSAKTEVKQQTPQVVVKQQQPVQTPKIEIKQQQQVEVKNVATTTTNTKAQTVPTQQATKAEPSTNQATTNMMDNKKLVKEAATSVVNAIASKSQINSEAIATINAAMKGAAAAPKVKPAVGTPEWTAQATEQEKTDRAERQKANPLSAGHDPATVQSNTDTTQAWDSPKIVREISHYGMEDIAKADDPKKLTYNLIGKKSYKNEDGQVFDDTPKVYNQIFASATDVYTAHDQRTDEHQSLWTKREDQKLYKSVDYDKGQPPTQEIVGPDGVARNYEDRVTSQTSIVLDDKKDVMPEAKRDTVVNDIVNPLKDKLHETSITQKQEINIPKTSTTPEAVMKLMKSRRRR